MAMDWKLSWWPITGWRVLGRHRSLLSWVGKSKLPEDSLLGASTVPSARHRVLLLPDLSMS
ncbi:hypothetical protein EJB05_14735, partial [Eragrostis curvula]